MRAESNEQQPAGVERVVFLCRTGLRHKQIGMWACYQQAGDGAQPPRNPSPAGNPEKRFP